MGYARNTRSADLHLQEKLELALISQAVPLLGTGNANEPLAAALVNNMKPGVLGLLAKVKALDSITVESTDVQLNSAVLNSGSIELLRDIYGVS